MAAAHQISVRGFSTPDAALAFRLDPLAAAAGERSVARLLDRGADGIEEARARARFLTAVSPIRARGWSLLADTEAALGDEARADALREAALTLKPTDLLALVRAIQRDVAVERPRSAAARLRLLLQRHPTQRDLGLAAVAPMLADAAGSDALLAVMMRFPDTGDALAAVLPRVPGGAEILYRFEAGMFERGVARPEARERSIAALKRVRPALAHRLFLATLDASARARAGYAFDPALSAPPDGLTYGWRADDRPGVSHAWAEGRGVTVAFRDRPVERIGLLQDLSLPAGRYRFATTVSGRRLRAPMGLQWSLRCLRPDRNVFVLPLREGSYAPSETSVEFDVPEDCRDARLELEPGRPSRSFRNAFSGELNVRAASITRMP